MNGVITAVNDGDIEIQAGALRMRAKIDDLQRINKSGELKEEEEKTVNKQTTVSHSGSINYYSPLARHRTGSERQRIEEAMEILEKYLEDAYLAGLPFVRIIHGKAQAACEEEVRSVGFYAVQTKLNPGKRPGMGKVGKVFRLPICWQKLNSK